jgi:predicted kinase
VPQPTLVIVSGIPGAGKTTLAVELGRVLSVPVLIKDVIKEGIARTEGAAATSGGSIASRTYGSMFECAAVLLRAGCSIVIEATFERKRFSLDARPVVALARPRVVRCAVAHDLAVERIAERANRAERFAHPDAAALDSMRSGAFDWEAYDLRPLRLPTLDVDTTDGYAPTLDQMIAFVVD